MRKFVKELLIIINLVGESTIIAFSSLKNDKFRTFLSLLGVSIGIFSIVMVFCAVDSLKTNVKKGLSSFGKDVVYVMESPWEVEGDNFKWWEYRERPPIRMDESEFLKKNSKLSQDIVFLVTFYDVFKHKRNSFSNGYVVATTPNLENVSALIVEKGRNISNLEYANGSNVTILGHSVAEVLFPNEDPVGKVVKIGNLPMQVIGVSKRVGESMVSIFDIDNAVIIPMKYGKNFVDINRRGGMIIASPKSGVNKADFDNELRFIMRAYRNIRITENDDFAINHMTYLVSAFDDLLKVINKVGWIIGAFSLLIGGFGIANIMFVSVKERTPQIGIQKALGAKRYFILTQFLFESAILSIAGGILGIMLVFIISIFMRNNESFPIILTLGNSLKGIAIAIVIGILSGIIPAAAGAKLDPVKAIS